MEAKVVELFGHRGVGCSVVGGESVVPENSIAAFEAAIELGLPSVEIDVWLTKDEEVVVIHGGGTDSDGFINETVINRTSQEIVHEKADNEFMNRAGFIDSNDTESCTDSLHNTRTDHFPNTKTYRRIEDIVYRDEQYNMILRQPWCIYRKHQATVSNQLEKNIIESCFPQILNSKQNCFLRNIGEYKSTWDSTQEIHLNPSSSQSTRGSSNASDIIPSSANTVTECVGTPPVEKNDLLVQDNHINLTSIYNTLTDPLINSEEFNANLTEPQDYSFLYPDAWKQRFTRTPDGILRHALGHHYRQLNESQQELVRIDYTDCSVPYIDTNNCVARIPLLKDIFQTFYGRLRFNVELKGTNPKLGPMVLDIARGYPGIITRISTFLWHPPFELSPSFNSKDSKEYHHLLPDIHNFPNGHVINDILSPIMKNSDNIPIALLFGGYRLPSLSRIVECMQKYQCDWIHIPRAFNLGCITDTERATALSVTFNTLPGIQDLLYTFPEASLSKSSDENGLQMSQDKMHDIEPPEIVVPRREILFKELLHLYFLTQEFHKVGYKVLVYGGRANEHPAILQLCILCGVDGLCPNNVPVAKQLCHKQ